ncbi:endo-1,4-beta-xylanase [Kiritimatiellaeota bacterium B1221]|nr:endo-1,4-beta-xylanase [Kiritimatiellaeota bacterium B1221]
MSAAAKADRKIVTENLFRPDAEIENRIQRDTERHRKGFAHLRVQDANGQIVENAKVEIKQRSHEFKFGCNMFLLDQFDDDAHNLAYEEAFAKVFNQAIIPFYWSDLEPEQGKPRFAKDSEPIYRRPPPDRCLEVCQERGIAPKGHPLLWQEFWPEWLPKDPASLRRVIEKRYQEISARYGNSIPTFDVCNEALALGGTHPLRDIGNHVDYAFALAEKYFPASTTLVYNETTDNSFTYFRGEHTPMYMLCEHLAERYPLGAVGLQFHLFDRTPEKVENYRNELLNPVNIFRFLDLYAKLGLPLKLSEITIPGYTLVDDGEQFQADVVEKLYRIWFSHPAMDEIDFWNLVDGTAAYSPRNTFEGENFFQGGLVNYDISPKAGYKVLDRLINEEWNTRETLEISAGKSAQFHGYYGNYEATIHYAGGVETVAFSHPKILNHEITLKLKEV